MIKELQNSFFHSKKAFQISLIIVATGLSFLVLKQLTFLFSPFLWAIVFFLTFRPLYLKLVKSKSWNKHLVAGLLVFILLILLLTLVYLAYLIINAKILPLIQNPALLKNTIQTLSTDLSAILVNTPFSNFDIVGQVTSLIPKIANSLIPFLKNIGGFIFDIFSSLLMFYILLINDTKIHTFFLNILPLRKEQAERLLERFENLVRGNAIVIPLVAISQGLLGLLGYFIFGIDFTNAIILGFLTMLSSIIPVVGTALVYIPVAIYLMLIGSQWLMGLFILIWGFVIIGSGDNIVRAFFQKKISNISFWYTVLGSIIGIQIFGLSGLIFGPILLILAISLWELYYTHYGLYEKETL